jgi:hypothetical protein
MRRLHLDGVPPTHGLARVHHEQDNDHEWQTVRAICPELAHGEGKRALYVGASRWRAFLLPDLLRGGYKTDVLEIDEGNCREIARLFPECRVVRGDISQQLRFPNYDLVLLIHVLEHCPEADAIAILSLLQRSCGAILCACPVDQETLDGPAYGNERESHLWSVPSGWFAERGFFETSTGDDRVTAIWRRDRARSV